jgi:retron-type reverse transcriptase
MAPFRNVARFLMVTATMTVRTFNLVMPLAHEATAMRIADTARHSSGRSGAISPLIGRCGLRRGDVDSMNNRSTLLTTTMPGTRTSTTATRTTTTSRRACAPARSADYPGGHHADFSFHELVQTYLDCRKAKRNTASAVAFEQNQERNLTRLRDELLDGSYRPGRSICFVITRPKAREVWAAEFRDRIVHHLLYNRIASRFYASFIADTCACIPGRGTLYAAKRLESKIRSASENWSRPLWYLKCDLANFFVSIDKQVLWRQIAARVTEPWWLWLADVILFHDPRLNYEFHGDPRLLERVPLHKRLANQPAHLGLPIGNLSSQFFANIYLNALDQHVKHQVCARHYVRYVDDFILLHESPQWLNGALASIDAFLPARLGARLNPTKTILQPIDRGVDFVGHLIKPWHTRARRRTVHQAIDRLRNMHADKVFAAANSYLGLLRQSDSSHADRALVAKTILRRGHAVNRDLTKAYRTSR